MNICDDVSGSTVWSDTNLSNVGYDHNGGTPNNKLWVRAQATVDGRPAWSRTRPGPQTPALNSKYALVSGGLKDDLGHGRQHPRQQRGRRCARHAVRWHANGCAGPDPARVSAYGCDCAALWRARRRGRDRLDLRRRDDRRARGRADRHQPRDRRKARAVPHEHHGIPAGDPPAAYPGDRLGTRTTRRPRAARPSRPPRPATFTTGKPGTRDSSAVVFIEKVGTATVAGVPAETVLRPQRRRGRAVQGARDRQRAGHPAWQRDAHRHAGRRYGRAAGQPFSGVVYALNLQRHAVTDGGWGWRQREPGARSSSIDNGAHVEGWRERRRQERQDHDHSARAVGDLTWPGSATTSAPRCRSSRDSCASRSGRSAPS